MPNARHLATQHRQ